MKTKNKVSFKDLNGWLKLSVIYGFINLGLIALMFGLFILGIVLGLLGY